MPLLSHNPATGQDVQHFEELSDDAVQEKIAKAQTAFASWKKTSFEHRASLMLELQSVLLSQERKWAAISTLEMGRPITQSLAAVRKCAWLCEYYAENAEKFLIEEHAQTENKESYVQFDPLGIILAVMPWNYPYWQVIRFAAPAIMSGNVGLLKHASNVPQCSEALEKMFQLAGFPEGVFQNLLIGSKKVEGILRDPRVQAATLTGSEYAGRKVAETCGDEIKKTLLELGGSDPFIVLADADLELACTIGTTARLQNTGQSCIAAKRFIVVEERYDEFVALYKKKYEQQIVGDPTDEKTTIGPMVSKQAVEEIDEQVKKSIALGAELIVGGKKVDRPGYFYEPTILGNVKKGMPFYDEEVFGPGAAIIKVKDEEEAIRVANDTPFGLGSSIWTTDIEKTKKLAANIDAGAVFINGMVKSDPRLPFGGIKKSGYGRELAKYGIMEFVNAKTVVVA